MNLIGFFRILSDLGFFSNFLVFSWILLESPPSSLNMVVRFCRILSNYFRILLYSLEFLRILVNTLGNSGILSNLSNKLDFFEFFHSLSDLSGFSRIFLDFLKLFRILLKSFVFAHIFLYSFGVSQIFLESRIFSNFVGLSSFFQILTYSFGFSNILSDLPSISWILSDFFWSLSSSPGWFL